MCNLNRPGSSASYVLLIRFTQLEPHIDRLEKAVKFVIVHVISVLVAFNLDLSECKGELAMHTPSSAVWTIIFVTIAGFLLELGIGAQEISSFALWPLQAGFMPWQLVTYAFLHAGLTHLAFNMYGFWMFGRN